MKTPFAPTTFFSLALIAASSAPASAVPGLTLTTTSWKSATGGCSQVIEHAALAGIAGDVQAIVDRDLTQAMVENQLPTLYLSKDDMAKRCVGSERGVSMGQVWTTGLASDRWLSVRLRQFVQKPSGGEDLEAYTCMTFDLKNADGPLSTGAFYTARTRPAFNAAIARFYGTHLDAVRRAFFRGLNVANTQILVTKNGAELTQVRDDRAHENDVVTLSRDALRGAYAKNGPLDPHAR